MANRWTDEQLDAINKEGQNIIVSAGAGSGKTAVLTERVLRKLKSGVNINNLLVLTFTKAAAHEMKERIRKSIKKFNELKNQLDMIDAAYITTFDSYALSIVKKYHYLLNVSKDVSICEASIINLNKEKYIEQIFNELYEIKNSKFLKLIGDFCTKDDKDIKNYILNISNKLDLKYDKTDYLQSYITGHFEESKILNDINDYTKILLDKLEIIRDELKNIEVFTDGNYYTKIHDVLNPLLNSRTYFEIKNNLDIKLPTLPKGTDDETKKYKENISNIIKDLKDLCVYSNIDEVKDCIYSTKDYIEVIIDIILKLDNITNKFKFENDIYEFTDIAKMAIKVLKENEDIREELKESFNEILVDEYQDTNDLQEEFISLISSNNVYMVGDIKQSIYRFRNANPYIFKSKYDNYSNNNGGIKIDLNKNFRSRKETLDNINVIFDFIMDDLIGGANYKATHRMIFGNMTYENEGKTNQDNNFEVLNYEYDRSKGFLKEEIEAFIIAGDIRNKVNNGYKVFDKDNLELRNVKYSDFVILMDRTTNFSLYKKIFEYMNISLTVFKDEVVNNGFDIYVIHNILKLVLKVKEGRFDEEYKYCFMSIARSFLFNISDNEIFNIIKNNTFEKNIIIKKIKNIISKLNFINNKELLELIIKEFDFYEKLIEIGNIEDAMIRIEYLSNLSISLSKSGYNIYDFIDYIDEISKKNYEIKYSSNTKENDSVKIMTIHKSKGLEYHICYYSGLYSKFNISDLKEKFTYDNTYGIIVPYVSLGISNTIYKYLLKDKYIKEEISEKIRLFYVALTRAKEKMILVSSIDSNGISKENFKDIVSKTTRLNYSSFDDILKSIRYNIENYFKKISLDGITLSKDYNLIKDNNYKSTIPRSSKIVNVHEINIENSLKEEKVFSKKENKLISYNDKKNLTFGKNMHYILEIIDFKNPNLDSLNLDEFYKNRIKTFISNPIFNNIENSKIYKEYEFKYEDNDNIYHGIIDLMIECENDIIIVDYKLKNIKDKNYYKQLNGYRKFIQDKTGKNIKTYLYSILDDTLEEIK